MGLLLYGLNELQGGFLITKILQARRNISA